MIDWKTLAAALDAPIDGGDWPRVLPVLEKLEREFRPMLPRIPHSESPWRLD